MFRDQFRWSLKAVQDMVFCTISHFPRSQLFELGFQCLVQRVLQLFIGDWRGQLLRDGLALEGLVTRYLKDFAGHLEELLHGLCWGVGVLLLAGRAVGGVQQSFVGHVCELLVWLGCLGFK